MSCRVVSYRVAQKEVEWVEGSRREEKKKPGARSQEPGAKGPERSQDQNEKE